MNYNEAVKLFYNALASKLTGQVSCDMERYRPLTVEDIEIPLEIRRWGSDSMTIQIWRGSWSGTQFRCKYGKFNKFQELIEDIDLYVAAQKCAQEQEQKAKIAKKSVVDQLQAAGYEEMGRFHNFEECFWQVNANGEVKLTVEFTSEQAAQFINLLNFMKGIV